MLFQEYGVQPPQCDGLTALLTKFCRCYGRGKVFLAGRSLLGRPIPLLGVGNLNCPVLMVGGVHCGEWLTVLLLLRFAEESLAALAGRQPLYGVELDRCLERRGLLVLPCLNPDGTEIALWGPSAAGFCSDLVGRQWYQGCLWQANARGVDLNHNFDAGWQQLHRLEHQQGIVGPCPSRYGGASPHSEPETQAVVNLCRRVGCSAVYAFHSQGEEIYYSYGSNTPPQSLMMAKLLAGCCGYRVAQPTGTAAHGGLKDWFIKETGRPGFTFEVGKGKNPLPLEDLPAIYDKLAEAMTAAVIL
ncbi:MAG: gamma-D-glutamyl-meso-diaminopimelate peptidase [Oscillospiraceae bacterium]|nr:gamma-D-glutamyl-meso-diaminopimelate peptidase [Oscillospiraceae bacterium]